MAAPELKNRLIDIKMLLEHGITHMNDISRIGRMLAIHHAHQAVELTLRIKAEEIGSNAYKYDKLVEDLKNSRKGSKGITIPNERILDQLNKARNLAQHFGQPSEQQDVVKLVSIAKEAVIDFWAQQFGVNYDDVGLLNLLQDKDIQDTLKQAENSLKEKKYDESVELSILAIHKNIWKLGWKFPPPALQKQGAGLMGFEIINPFERWDDFLYVVLSLPYASKLKELKGKTGIVHLPIPGGQPIMQRLKDYHATEDDAFFAHALATEYSLWIEQMYF